MKRRYAVLLLLPVCAWFAGCATLPDTHPCAQVGPDGQFCLLAPAVLPVVTATHIISVTRGGRQDTFMGVLQIDGHALRLAGVSLFGTRLFTIDFDGHTITSQPVHLDWRPAMIVMIVELAIGDPATLQRRMHNLTFTVSQRRHTQVRELFEHGRVMVRIVESDAPLPRADIRIEIPPAAVLVHMTPILGAQGRS